MRRSTPGAVRAGGAPRYQCNHSHLDQRDRPPGASPRSVHRAPALRGTGSALRAPELSVLLCASTSTGVAGDAVPSKRLSAPRSSALYSIRARVMPWRAWRPLLSGQPTALDCDNDVEVACCLSRGLSGCTTPSPTAIQGAILRQRDH